MTSPGPAKRPRDEILNGDSADPLQVAQTRYLNVFGGAACMATGTQIEAMGPLALALDEYALEHAAPTSLRARFQAADDADDDDPRRQAFFSTLAGEPFGPSRPKDAAGSEPSTTLSLAFGVVDISFETRTFVLTRQGFGEFKPCKGAYTNIVLSHPERGPEITEALRRLCNAAQASYERARPGKIALYGFIKYGPGEASWQRERLLLKRPLESVILPAEAKDRVTKDVQAFLGADTRTWYLKHGIPYKRTFLLHGPPGCGKSSLIRAVASEFDCSVCMVSLASKDLEDSDLRTAMTSVPKKAVVAFEDVDALFGHHRERGEGTHNVTFSGLLNALDGVADPQGTVIFLTTNHRGRLDPALIRAGRCDVQVEVAYASDEQLHRALVHFYVDASEADAMRFADNVRAKGGAKVAMSQVQEHFVQHRTSALEQAICDIRLGEQNADCDHSSGDHSFYS